jgi:tetratricopeptide (TPR) repeat protein
METSAPAPSSDFAREAETSLQSGKVDDAVVKFTEAIQKGDTSAGAHGGLARALSQQDNFAESIVEFDKSIALEPKNDILLEGRGTAYNELAKQGDASGIDKAIGDFTAAIDVAPSRIGPLFGRGEAYFIKKDYERALTDLEECVKRSDRFQRAWLLKGMVNVALGSAASARADFEKVVALDSTGENLGPAAKAEIEKLLK